MEAGIGGAKLQVFTGDITEQETDAVVNAANKQLAPGGGVAGAIHRAAGSELWEKCATMGGCETGEAKITSGYNLPAKWIVHTVGPVYSGSAQDAELLAQCYTNSLRLVEEQGVESISFPALSTGAFGYPLEEAAKVALRTVASYLEEQNSALKIVRFVLFDQKSKQVHEQVLKDLGF